MCQGVVDFGDQDTFMYTIRKVQVCISRYVYLGRQVQVHIKFRFEQSNMFFTKDAYKISLKFTYDFVFLSRKYFIVFMVNLHQQRNTYILIFNKLKTKKYKYALNMWWWTRIYIGNYVERTSK